MVTLHWRSNCHQIWICWDDRIVDAFVPAEDLLEPSDFVQQYFTEDGRLVSDYFCNAEPTNTEKFINHGIHISLADSKLGLCHWIHEKVIYKYGFSHTKAIELGHLAARLVDSPKQGLLLKPEKWKEFDSLSKLDKPAYWATENETKPQHSRHVMDILILHTMPKFRSEILMKFTGALGKKDQIPLDSDVKAFYDKIYGLRPDIIEAIRQPLKELKKEWGRFWVGLKGQPVSNRSLTQLKKEKLVERPNCVYFRMNSPQCMLRSSCQT